MIFRARPGLLKPRELLGATIGEDQTSVLVEDLEAGSIESIGLAVPGMPVGSPGMDGPAYGGRRDLMERIAPSGPIYQAGTLSGNPVAMAAGYAQLSILHEQPELYAHLNALGEKLASGLSKIAPQGVTVQRVGSLICPFFTQSEVKNYQDALKSDTKAYAAYFAKMLEQGIYLAPAQFEAMFISAAHTEEMIGETVEAMARSLS